MSRRAFILPALLTLVAPAALVVACGGDNKAPQTAANTAGSGSTGTTTIGPKTMPLNPVNDTTVPHTSNNSGINISDEIKRLCGITDAEAYFAFDSSALQGTDIPPLDKVATCFMTGPLAGKTLQLIGRADIVGEAQYNYELSGRRAGAVQNYMNAKMDPKRIETSPQGSNGATAQANDPAGMAKDRRVDVQVKHCDNGSTC
jgi:outer membrane protein OmpA-like peptidoglycan-associated protein